MSRPLTAAGRAHLKKRLLSMPEKMRRRVDEALSKSADELVADIKAAAPVSPGGGELRDSIRKEPLGDDRIGYKVVGGKKGKGRQGWYIRFVEFGTQPGKRGERVASTGAKQAKNGRLVYRTHPGNAAQPFFFPTYRKNKSRIRSRRTRALKKGATEQ